MTLYIHLLAPFHFVRLLSQLIRLKFQSLTALYILKKHSNQQLIYFLAAFTNKKAKCYAVKVQNRNTGKVFGLIPKQAPTFQTEFTISGTKALSMSGTAIDEAVITTTA